MSEEPTEILGNDLLERLKSLRNRIDIGVILVGLNKEALIYTILEDIYYHSQNLLDKYCVKQS